MRAKVHVNGHVLRANKRDGTTFPPLVAKAGRRRVYGQSVEIAGPSRLVHRPDRPLNCGAVVWVEADAATVSVDGVPLIATG